MNERSVVNFLNKQISKERVNALAQTTNAALPGAGVVVAILGALVLRAVAAAKEYINRVDQAPIVPPDLLRHLTYTEAVRLFQQKQLKGMFKELLAPAADVNNPNINRDRVLVARAASVVKKCFDGDDGLFNVFYQNQIAHGEYLTVWKTYPEFLEFKARVRDLLPPAAFQTMFDTVVKAVAKEGVQQIKKSDAFSRVKDLVKAHANKIVPDNIVDIDKILEKIGKIT